MVSGSKQNSSRTVSEYHTVNLFPEEQPRLGKTSSANVPVSNGVVESFFQCSHFRPLRTASANSQSESASGPASAPPSVTPPSVRPPSGLPPSVTPPSTPPPGLFPSSRSFGPPSVVSVSVPPQPIGTTKTNIARTPARSPATTIFLNIGFSFGHA